MENQTKKEGTFLSFLSAVDIFVMASQLRALIQEYGFPMPPVDIIAYDIYNYHMGLYQDALYKISCFSDIDPVSLERVNELQTTLESLKDISLEPLMQVNPKSSGQFSMEEYKREILSGRKIKEEKAEVIELNHFSEKKVGYSR